MSVTKLRPLVSTNWLSDRLAALTSGRQLRVLDVSFQKDPQFDSYGQDYKPKHIPGSKHFDAHRCVTRTVEIPRNLPERGCFTNYVRSLGVGSDTHIVAYDRDDNKMACRTWWLFRLHGHENVSVLDGGLGKWVANGFPTSSEEPDFEEGDFEPVMNYNILRDYEAMVKNLETKAEVVVDSRPKDMFNGIDEDNVGGHIPGAKNLPFGQLFNEDGTFRSKEELQQMFDDIDVDLSEPMVASCRLGLTACGLALAAQLAGKSDVPVYYGSWTEWSRRAPRNLIA